MNPMAGAPAFATLETLLCQAVIDAAYRSAERAGVEVAVES